MYLKVEYNNLNDTGKYFLEKSKELDTLVKEIDSLKEELKNYWDGDDYYTFVNSYNNHLKEVTATAIELNAFGNTLKKVSNVYEDLDVSFGNRVHKMRNDKYGK